MEFKEDLKIKTIIATFPIRSLKDDNCCDIDYKKYIHNSVAAPIVNRNFKSIRILAGFTQTELAKIFDVTKQTICQKETGATKPSINATIGFTEFLRNNNTKKAVPTIFADMITDVKNPKVDLLWPIALKCLDKAFQIGNEDYDIDKDLKFLVNIMPLNITLIKVIIDRINF